MKKIGLFFIALLLIPAAAETECKIAGKKVLMIIASKDFQDTEYKTPRKILEDAGASVIVASSTSETVRGMSGMTVKPDLALKDARASNYSAVVFVGGSGADEYWNNSNALGIARDANGGGKVVAAICISPVTLGNAGILKGKKVTVWPSQASKLTGMGAVVNNNAVAIDGNIITGRDPAAAADFGEAIKNKLCE